MDEIFCFALETSNVTLLSPRSHRDHREEYSSDNLGFMPDGLGLDRLLKYEGAIERQFYKAINQLERLQRLRAGDHVPAPANIDLHIDTGRAD